MRDWTIIAGAAAMTAILAVSNYLVRFAINDWLTWAAFTYPLAFLVADCVNRSRGAKAARRVAAMGFFCGVPLSFFFNYFTPDEGASAMDAILSAVRIAAASGGAFLLAQLLDISIFDRLRKREWWRAPLISSAAGSTADTFFFFFVAFAFSGLPWITWALGDLAAKAAMIILLLPPYRLFAARFAPA